MAFYSSHSPIQLYAYAPMAIPNQPEFYAVYPGGGQPVVDASTFYYEANPKGMMSQSGQCQHIMCLQSTAATLHEAGGRFRPSIVRAAVRPSALSFTFLSLCAVRDRE